MLRSLAGRPACSASYTSARAGANSNNIPVGPITLGQISCYEETSAPERGHLTWLRAAAQ
jgi:hypothetical protein